jgi:hypothetical protein
VDDDLLRGLDWELEEIGDGDARELVVEAVERYRSGDAYRQTAERLLGTAQLYNS